MKPFRLQDILFNFLIVDAILYIKQLELNLIIFENTFNLKQYLII